ncbi:MAG: hypothetical protein DRJ08_06805 [Acidobacteria bacterium]|nr:MAG: hypothetical protein DRJ14_07765 [Acidobacteriota bacterium]RLE20564.1 MAG: hypothetical protein DRJ08_06805 [Acidobacteriota bacterium]
METHVKIVAILNLILSGMMLLAGLIIFVVLVSGGLLSGDKTAIAVTSGLGVFFAILFLVLSIPAIVGAIGTLKYKNWGRILLIIVGILNLPGFPVGTALGAYTLWVLFQKESELLFTDGKS